MSYNVNYFNLLKKNANPTTQTLSTSYTEIDGSKGELAFSKSNVTFIYKFSFYAETKWINASTYYRPFMHIKLQKSNDNFSSNIEDIPGCNTNFSGETQQASDHYYKVCNIMFVVEDLSHDYKHLRLVARSYGSSWNNPLHTTNFFDGSTTDTVYYEPILEIIEI